MTSSYIPRARYTYSLRDMPGFYFETWVGIGDTTTKTYDVWARAYTDDIDRHQAEISKLDMTSDEIESCGLNNHSGFLQKVVDKLWKKI